MQTNGIDQTLQLQLVPTCSSRKILQKIVVVQQILKTQNQWQTAAHVQFHCSWSHDGSTIAAGKIIITVTITISIVTEEITTVF